MSYLTAYGALVEVGQVQPGEEVVITAASSSVGLAAIQIANQLGAVPIAVTRTPAKAERLRAAGAAHVLSMTDGDIAAQVRELTGGRGGRLIFDCVAGPGFAALARAAAPRGMVIVYGWLDPRPAPLPMNWPLHIVGYGLPFVTDDPAALQRAESYIRAGLQSGALTPTIDSTFDLADIAAAHRRLETGDQLGKIVVTVAHPRHREGPEMTTTPADLVHRFMDAINDTDPIRRRTTIHDICTPDIAYTDPDDHVEGPDALDALFARLQARIPGGFRFALTGAIDSHHQQARFAWAFGPVDSRAVATGSDVVAFANGRIHRVYSFFDPAAD
jgi:hypothetical protein